MTEHDHPVRDAVLVWVFAGALWLAFWCHRRLSAQTRWHLARKLDVVLSAMTVYRPDITPADIKTARERGSRLPHAKAGTQVDD